MANKISFFIIDEDKNNIITLKKIIAKVFTTAVVYHAHEGVYAWEFIRKQPIPMVIICDMELPGINGIQLMQKIKSTPVYKDSFFILMTPQNFPKDQLLKLLQSGCDGYLTKPLAIEPLFAALKAGAGMIDNYIELTQKTIEINKLTEELYQSANQLKETVVKIQQYRFTEQKEIFERITSAGLWILKSLNENTDEATSKDIENAASMIYIGKLFLPDKSINDPVMIGGFAKNETMEQVPRFAKELIDGLKGFELASDILYHLYENYDGSGIPDKIKGWEIPLGSRILRVVLDFEELLLSSKKPISKVMEMLDHESKRLYDFRCVALMDQYLAASGREKISEEKPMDPHTLKPGNIISRGIVTHSGIKLISAGTILKEENIEKVRTIIATDPVIGHIWIKAR